MLAALATITVLTMTQPSPWHHWANTTVTWKGDPPTDLDWVGIYLVDWPASYVLFQSIIEYPGAPPATALTFRLLNSRGDYFARYYRGDKVLATSGPITPEGARAVHPRLTLLPSTPSSMMISWTSNRTSGNPSVLVEPLNAVFRGKATLPVYAESRTYTRKDIGDCLGYAEISEQRTIPWPRQEEHTLRCGEDCGVDTTALKLFYPPGWLHNATVGPLLPSTTYRYTIGDDSDNSMRNATFVTAPMKGSREDLNLLYVADIGGVRNTAFDTPEELGSATHNSMNVDDGKHTLKAMIAAHEKEAFRLCVINGDLTYANGWMWMWERWMDAISPLSASVPMAVTMGNHEVDYEANTKGAPWANEADSGGECGIPTSSRFHVPPLSGYSFDFGSVHFVMLNSEGNLTAQQIWVEKDLSSLDRQMTPWVIVLLHRPMFGSYNVNLEFKAFATTLLGQTFSRNKVDVVFGAHKHYYERMAPIDNVTYIIDGSGGRSDFDIDDSIAYESSRYAEFGHVGYTRIRVRKNASELVLERTRSKTQAVVDEVILVKGIN